MFVLLMARHALHTLSPTLRIVCISFDTEHRLEARERNCRVVKSCYTESRQRSFRKKFFQGISSGVTMTTYSGTAYPMAEQGSSSPIFLSRHGSASIKPLSLNLTLRSCGSVYTRQKRRFSTVCKSWHKAPTAQTIKLKGRPLRMLSRASAFSSGTISGFLTGKRSKNHAAMW